MLLTSLQKGQFFENIQSVSQKKHVLLYVTIINAVPFDTLSNFFIIQIHFLVLIDILYLCNIQNIEAVQMQIFLTATRFW